jgi:L-2-hydroxyglutarate oxidase LhgO
VVLSSPSIRLLRELEPNVHPNCISALYSPSAGNVIPYEFAIALCENAADNGVEFRIRREVTKITKVACNDSDASTIFQITCRHWEPIDYVKVHEKKSARSKVQLTKQVGIPFFCITLIAFVVGYWSTVPTLSVSLASLSLLTFLFYQRQFHYKSSNQVVTLNEPAENVIKRALPPIGSGGNEVSVEEMFTGGSGSWIATNGQTVDEELVFSRYIVNAAGGASDKIARMIGDDSFVIKPRLGDYLLLNRNQGHLTSHTLFPCPDPILGKGVLVQTTLWGNLILGPTAREKDMSKSKIQDYILSKCKQLVPYFDPKETIHAFCGARAKSSRGDWIIEASEVDPSFIHAAGIDSPGLAGSPAIALEIVRLLQNAGLKTLVNHTFNPYRAPIVTPKQGMRGLKIGPIGKNDSHGLYDVYDQNRMASNVVCKCEKVTEAEIVRAMRRSLPIDGTQAIRKRTRAGMGHCQGDKDNYNCECRVKAIIARENRSTLEEVGGRPWPATSSLSKRWIDSNEKAQLESRMST